MANRIFQRWMPPVYSSYPTCSTYNKIDSPSPRGESLFPSLKSGCRLVTAPTLKVRQTWSYGVSEAVREKMQPPPGVLPWRHLALDWWWLCWGAQVERSHRSRDPWLRSPRSPGWEDAPRLQTHGWRSLHETLPPTAVTITSWETQAGTDQSSHDHVPDSQKPWAMKTDCCWFKSCNVGEFVT